MIETQKPTPEVTAQEFAKLNVLDRLNKVESMLTSADPMMPVHLKNIHASLLEYEELVHMLDDKEIHILMAGMQRFRGISLAKEASAKKRVRLSNTTVDDL